MLKLLRVGTGVTIGLLAAVILMQIQYTPEVQPKANGSKTKKKAKSAYGKKPSYQGQSKAGKGKSLTNEAQTGNTD